MHKKDIVKKVLNDYIKKGHDFFELTPSFLSELKELKGYSERTLKRGRTEFKLANKTLVSSHSKTSANLKKRVYFYLKENPGATPKLLRETFPKIDAKMLTKIRTLWKAAQGGPKENKIKKVASDPSLRQKVFNFLSDKPSQTLSRLEKSFPDFNKKTLSNYLDQWRKDKTLEKPTKSAKDKVADFLTRNPYSKVKDIKKALPEINPSSVNTYFSLWRKSQKAAGVGKARTRLSKGAIAKATPAKSTKDDIIQALKETVEAQKKAIEALKSQNAILSEKQGYEFPELEGLSKKDVEKVESVIQTFIRGMKSR